MTRSNETQLDEAARLLGEAYRRGLAEPHDPADDAERHRVLYDIGRSLAEYHERRMIVTSGEGSGA